MKISTMSVELLFDKHATEFNHFERIDVGKRFTDSKAASALQYISNLANDAQGKTLDIQIIGEGMNFSHPDLDLNAMTEADVVYLLRCGVKYDRENDCLLYRY